MKILRRGFIILLLVFFALFMVLPLSIGLFLRIYSF